MVVGKMDFSSEAAVPILSFKLRLLEFSVYQFYLLKYHGYNNNFILYSTRRIKCLIMKRNIS